MRTRYAILAAALLALATPALADEGMWTFDNLPLAQLQQRYGFTPTPEWIEHVQRACVNFGGGSGAFVSADGLVLTNHHVAMGQLAKMSSRRARLPAATASSRTRRPRRCPAPTWSSRCCGRWRTSPPR